MSVHRGGCLVPGGGAGPGGEPGPGGCLLGGRSGPGWCLVETPSRTATAVGGTHPTGLHPFLYQIDITKSQMSNMDHYCQEKYIARD